MPRHAIIYPLSHTVRIAQESGRRSVHPAADLSSKPFLFDFSLSCNKTRVRRRVLGQVRRMGFQGKKAHITFLLTKTQTFSRHDYVPRSVQKARGRGGHRHFCTALPNMSFITLSLPPSTPISFLSCLQIHSIHPIIINNALSHSSRIILID